MPRIGPEGRPGRAHPPGPGARRRRDHGPLLGLRRRKHLPGEGRVANGEFHLGLRGSRVTPRTITGPTAEARQEANDLLLAELDPLPAGVEEVTSDLEGDQPTAVVVNTSRGGMVDTAALAEACRTKKIAGAAA